MIVNYTALTVYMLDFPTDAKKISYAASTGKCDILTPEFIDRIKLLDRISVREKSLSDILSHENIDVYCVCDPVFLLQRHFWDEKSEQITNKIGKYIFLYYVDGEGRERREDICRLATAISTEYNLPIRYSATINKSTINIGKNVFSDGPLQFIAEIKNASFVVASSFHAIVFSIIFEKEFVAILHKRTGDRVKDLLCMLNLSDRIVENIDDYKKKNFAPIDYRVINMKLESFRKYSLSILEKMIND